MWRCVQNIFFQNVKWRTDSLTLKKWDNFRVFCVSNVFRCSVIYCSTNGNFCDKTIRAVCFRSQSRSRSFLYMDRLMWSNSSNALMMIQSRIASNCTLGFTAPNQFRLRKSSFFKFTVYWWFLWKYISVKNICFCVRCCWRPYIWYG